MTANSNGNSAARRKNMPGYTQSTNVNGARYWSKIPQDSHGGRTTSQSVDTARNDFRDHHADDNYDYMGKHDEIVHGDDKSIEDMAEKKKFFTTPLKVAALVLVGVFIASVATYGMITWLLLG